MIFIENAQIIVFLSIFELNYFELMKYIFLVVFLLLTAQLFPQSDSTRIDSAQSDSTQADFELFTVTLKDSLLTVISNEGDLVYSRSFQHPDFTTADLDSDGVEEYIVTDYKTIDGNNDYTLFVYNTLDTFYCVDSIRSGFIEPYFVYSQEVESNIIVAGMAQFNELNLNKDDISLPVSVWKYDDASLTNINNEIYDLFESESDAVIDYLEDYFDSNVESCNSSKEAENIIAAGYVNLLSAGEISVASQFLKKYYLCPDIESFRLRIENLAKVK